MQSTTLTRRVHLVQSKVEGQLLSRLNCSQGLEFKGQMLYCHESDCLLFLASPLVDGLEALTSRGLFISDIPIHDATRDIVLVGEQARAQVSTIWLSRPEIKFLIRIY